ncbi:hypothetical protein WN944_010546 [Citrus x changshan-huyou]|uniref:Uncharacterized protein n=1 Tax=Citrus x changshan-huyou TaxID=2935761 RepID=A0AAP0MTW7_9ROSI
MALANHPIKDLYFMVVGVPQKLESYNNNDKLHGKAEGCCGNRKRIHGSSTVQESSVNKGDKSLRILVFNWDRVPVQSPGNFPGAFIHAKLTS